MHGECLYTIAYLNQRPIFHTLRHEHDSLYFMGTVRGYFEARSMLQERKSSKPFITVQQVEQSFYFITFCS